MKKATIKWGIGGAVGVLLIEIVLVIIQESQPYGSPFRDSVHSIVFATVAPVVWVWESLGVRGEAGMRFLVPIFASILLYLAGIGFLAGAGLGKLRSMI